MGLRMFRVALLAAALRLQVGASEAPECDAEAADETGLLQLRQASGASAAEAESCSKASVGTCLVSGCVEGRNAECRSARCVCRPGFCAVKKGLFSLLEGGSCRLPQGTWKANVATVTLQHPVFPKPHNDILTAVCFSGGGARSGSLVIGQLRALETLGLMSKADAVSAVSGALFSLIPYMFGDMASYEHRGDYGGEPMWGNPTIPSELTLDVLDYHTSPLGTQFADGWGQTWGMVKKVTGILASVTNERGAREAIWRNLMTKQFLKPWGLGKEDCFMAADDAAEQRIRAANKQLGELCFYKPKPGKPKVFVIGASLLAQEGEKKTDAVPFQISPDWVGSPFLTNIAHRPLYSATNGSQALGGGVVGGGLIETFAFGGQPPAEQSAGLRDVPVPERPFTLADAMAIATYAEFLPGSGWTPIYRYWPVGEGREEAKRFMIGDGGLMEDTGMLQMLQRQAARVVLFLNIGTGEEISDDVDYCALDAQIRNGAFDPKTFNPDQKFCDSLYTMFGFAYETDTYHKSHNQVFKQEEMFEVACELQKLKKKGKPPVYRRSHDVQENRYWGIRPYEVEILYVYNERVPEFERQLPADTQDALKGDLKGFPTGLTAGLFVKPRSVKLMAALAEYTVMQNADLFKHMFRPK